MASLYHRSRTTDTAHRLRAGASGLAPVMSVSTAVCTPVTDNRTIVRAAWRAFASHDAEQIAPGFTADAEWRAPEGNATAVALAGPGHIIGREAITQFSPTTSGDCS